MTEHGRNLFRMLLAHTPDQFAKAVEADFDLMFAGHTTVGKFPAPDRPVFVPSAYGNTLATRHISPQEYRAACEPRAIIGYDIRFGSCPQVSFLTLHPTASPA